MNKKAGKGWLEVDVNGQRGLITLGRYVYQSKEMSASLAGVFLPDSNRLVARVVVFENGGRRVLTLAAFQRLLRRNKLAAGVGGQVEASADDTAAAAAVNE